MVLFSGRPHQYRLKSNRSKLDLILPLATVRPSLHDHATGVGAIVSESTVSQLVLRICRGHTAVARGESGGFGSGQASNAWSTSRWPTAGDDDVVSGFRHGEWRDLMLFPEQQQYAQVSLTAE
jgi:hypothetical protein